MQTDYQRILPVQFSFSLGAIKIWSWQRPQQKSHKQYGKSESPENFYDHMHVI